MRGIERQREYDALIAYRAAILPHMKQPPRTFAEFVGRPVAKTSSRTSTPKQVDTVMRRWRVEMAAAQPQRRLRRRGSQS